MQPTQQDDSLESLLAQAKQAQALVGQLDLSLIAEHDESEIMQMKEVIAALEKIENLHSKVNPDITDTADAKATTHKTLESSTNPAPENVLNNPPKQSAKPHESSESAILALIMEAGFESRVDRIFFSGSDYPVKPLSYVPHKKGLPKFDVCIAPESAPIDGAQGIFISTRGVFCAAVPEPVASSEWRIIRSMPYESNDEMLDLVHRFID